MRSGNAPCKIKGCGFDPSMYEKNVLIADIGMDPDVDIGTFPTSE